MRHWMRNWNLSTKILASYSILIAVMAGTLTSGLYWQLRSSQRQAIRDRLLVIVSLAAPQINSDYHSLVVRPSDRASAYYKINQDKLVAIQATSQDIQHIYTVRQQPDKTFVYVLNYDPADLSKSMLIGMEYNQEIAGLKTGIAQNAPFVEPDFHQTDTGETLLRGYAPIVDPLGRVNGFLVVELDASSVARQENWVTGFALVTFLVVLLLTVVVVRWLSQSLVVRPILQLNHAAKHLATGNWDAALPGDRADELGELAKSFNSMVSQFANLFCHPRTKGGRTDSRIAGSQAERGQSQPSKKRFFGNHEP